MDFGTVVLVACLAILVFLFVLRPGYAALENWFDQRRFAAQKRALGQPEDWIK